MRFSRRLERKPIMSYLLRRLALTVILAVIPAGLIFGLAGRWDLWNVWTYAGIFVVLFSFLILALYRKKPDSLKELVNPPSRGRFGFSFTFIAPLVLLILHWSIAGLDQRFHWSDTVPLAGLVAGLVVVAIGFGLLTWAVLVNPFYSASVRIQEERGQRVISAGPYAIVRHPGYAGIILGSVASGVALNSLVSIIPIVIEVSRLIYRMMIEDRMLQDDLAGYADYAAKVRYHLIPGLW
jgi:protein-S-isoprenylcysteine O-methyltransferase Ste14